MNHNSSDTLLSESVRQYFSLIQAENGFAFRDLSKDGRLDVYKDPGQPIYGWKHPGTPSIHPTHAPNSSIMAIWTSKGKQ